MLHKLSDVTTEKLVNIYAILLKTSQRRQSRFGSKTDLIDTAWVIENSKRKNKCSGKSCLEILREDKLKPCNTDAELGIQCNGSWVARAMETL